MNQTDPSTESAVTVRPAASFLVRQSAYLVLLGLAVIGIGYTSLSPDASVRYWKVLAPAFAIVCIVSQWTRVPAGGEAKTRLVITQLLHWGAFLLTIVMLFLPDMQQRLGSLVTAEMVLYLLALSTFLAGLYNTSWQLIAVGTLMALAVPAIAFLQRSALLIVMIAVAAAIGVGAVMLRRRQAG